MPSLVRSLRPEGYGRSLDGSFSLRRSRGSHRWDIGSWLAFATGSQVGHRPARYDREQSCDRMRVVRPSDRSSIWRLFDALHSAEPTFDEVGFTLTGMEPSGPRNGRYQAGLGQGLERFCGAVEDPRSWKPHRQPGIQVLAKGTEIQSGATVIVTLGTPVHGLAAPCRTSKWSTSRAGGGLPTGHSLVTPNRGRRPPLFPSPGMDQCDLRSQHFPDLATQQSGFLVLQAEVSRRLPCTATCVHSSK